MQTAQLDVGALSALAMDFITHTQWPEGRPYDRQGESNCHAARAGDGATAGAEPGDGATDDTDDFMRTDDPEV
ncbi:hypothetical protein TanjilG_19474 [Lupinus angustifolius]|uniref:Uncharacterized protein n=1 Tax=Lupinus angustifolius TaxID=3871 RepID=A0A1J7HMK7_LUPAN|nr:hypothetical protein TanjilG_19474 [Lupinus angustifolius]